jgi:hypothetical protein
VHAARANVASATVLLDQPGRETRAPLEVQPWVKRLCATVAEVSVLLPILTPSVLVVAGPAGAVARAAEPVAVPRLTAASEHRSC